MAFEAEGKLYKKMDTVQVTDSFRKRELVIELEDGAYNQYIKFELLQDKCDSLDPFNEGDKVRVSFNLRGREWTSPQGEVKYFTSLNAWRVEAVKAENTAAAPPVAGGGDDFPSASDEPSGGNLDDLPF